MKLKKMTKKDLYKKKKCSKEEGHWEGKHWCNCKTRNVRMKFGLKYFGGKYDSEYNQSSGLFENLKEFSY